MTDMLRRLRDAAAIAFDGEPIAFAFVFGSHATGTAGPRSDIDIAVHLRLDGEVDEIELRLRLARALEAALGSGPVEVVILDAAPLSLAGRVQETGRVVYSADDVARVRHSSRISRMYHDFKFHEQRAAAERLARLASGR